MNLAPHRLADLKTIHAGQHHIQDDQVTAFYPQCLSAVSPGKMTDRIAVLFQVKQIPGPMQFIFHQHDTWFVITHNVAPQSGSDRQPCGPIEAKKDPHGAGKQHRNRNGQG